MCIILRRYGGNLVFAYMKMILFVNYLSAINNLFFPQELYNQQLKMDLRETQIIDIHNFFEEESLPLRLPPPHFEVSEISDLEHAFPFDLMEDSLGLFEYPNRLPLPTHYNLEEIYIGDNNDVDTNPLDDLLASNQAHEQPASNRMQSNSMTNELHVVRQQSGEQPGQAQLIQMINYLVQFSNQANLKQVFTRRFQAQRGSSVSEVLIDKFKKLKKTKEELIKYCMRKAFKFILELPKNKHILNSEKSQKFSFSKNKNRYLKKISEQKSMNNKFLQQIFGDKDFAQDYQLFLEHFQQIMVEDNEKKIKYLAYLLTNEKDGKKKSAEVVKRLPWTHPILEKVRKISVELLRFSKG